MDTVRGNFGPIADNDGYDPAEDDAVLHTPPPGIGQDERRMQVRAYNHWASLLEDRYFPSIEDLEPESLPDFGPYSVLLDFSVGIENPGIAYMGEKLAEECGVVGEELETLADVPQRSLLTRITDHYMQILANQTPIGFEAEFVNQRGRTLAYRGILLPYSSDDESIDFIYGVINWKELPDAQDSDELLLEIDQVLEARLQPVSEEDLAADEELIEAALAANAKPVEVPDVAAADISPVSDTLPVPSFGFDQRDDLPVELEQEELEQPRNYYSFDAELDHTFEEEEEPDAEDDIYDEEEETAGRGPSFGSLLKIPVLTTEGSGKTPIELGDLPEGPAFDLSEYVDAEALTLPEVYSSADMGLGDWLAAAREMADAANNSEDRTRSALYEAIGRAYDFSLAAIDNPGDFDEILVDAGLSMQDRAPMTPVVKLVFGADYDKTRLTEYASALTHAHRLELPRGTLGAFLREAEGGLKGVVKAERLLRRQEAGKEVEALESPREAIARKLRALPALAIEDIAADGAEFALVMVRRTESGELVILGEIPDDVALVEKAAKRLIG